MTQFQQIVTVSDPPVREAGTVQADVDELVGLTNIWILCEVPFKELKCALQVAKLKEKGFGSS